MRVVIVTAGLGALLLSACVTPVEQQASATKAADAPAQAVQTGEIDMNEVVCRKQQATGTRFGKEVCKTRQEWEDAAKAGGDPLSGSQRRALQFSPPGG